MAAAALVAEADGAVAGVVTVNARRNVGNIGLLSVDDHFAGRFAGRGMGSSLLEAAWEWFLRNGCVRAEVVTQGGNHADCRQYGKYGYRVGNREHTYHFWL